LKIPVSAVRFRPRPPCKSRACRDAGLFHFATLCTGARSVPVCLKLAQPHPAISPPFKRWRLCICAASHSAGKWPRHRCQGSLVSALFLRRSRFRRRAVVFLFCRCLMGLREALRNKFTGLRAAVIWRPFPVCHCLIPLLARHWASPSFTRPAGRSTGAIPHLSCRQRSTRDGLPLPNRAHRHTVGN